MVSSFLNSSSIETEFLQSFDRSIDKPDITVNLLICNSLILDWRHVDK